MEKEGDFMHRPYTIAELRTIIAPIARKHGVKKVSVFGSVARGEARPDSDIDLCIENRVGIKDVGRRRHDWKQ